MTAMLFEPSTPTGPPLLPDSVAVTTLSDPIGSQFAVNTPVALEYD